MAKVLGVIDSAYRVSLEEQDDAGMWFSGAISKAGSAIPILLIGNAVNYATKGYRTAAMQLGGAEIPHAMNPRATNGLKA